MQAPSSTAPRLLTTHTGSLPRVVVAGTGGADLRPARSDDEAVQFAVQRQISIGLDIVNDGEMARSGYVHYLADRLTGLSQAARKRLALPDLAEFPGFEPPFIGEFHAPPQAFRCSGPIGYTGTTALDADIARVRSHLDETVTGFMTVPSPATVALFIPDEHYRDRARYLEALGDALCYEYRAIVNAGLVLQVDAPDIAIDASFASPADQRRRREANVAALNRALDGLPPERMRLHLCWGNYPGPHHFDVALDELVDHVTEALPATVAFETANPRHGHEHAAWARLARAGKRLAPGVIDSTTNYIEHPQLVAQRLREVMAATSTDSVIATTDCGFACSAGRHYVDPRIAWAKLAALVEGAALVT